MNVEELDVFQLVHGLTIDVYRITESFPNDERFGLVSQMRRAASSIPSNLMEGSHRVGTNELPLMFVIDDADVGGGAGRRYS